MDAEHRWTLLGLLAMAVALVAPQINLRSRDPASSERPAHHSSVATSEVEQRVQELMLDRSFDVGTGAALKVDVSDGDVEVRSGATGSASVKVYVQARDGEWGREVFERMQFDVGKDGDGVAVRARDAQVRDYEWRDRRGVGVKVEITIPEDFKIDIRTSDGDVDIGRINGPVEVRTSDGDIGLGMVRGPEISVETSDGDVIAESLEAESISLQTSDGDIDVGIRGTTTRISTSDGDIRLRLLAPGAVSLRTGDGDITVYTDRSLPADLELHADDVYLESEIQIEGRIGDRGARGKLNGGGPLLVARTGDGTISIREN
ncbi:MAG: DUF4097 family beta strand repeat-containing protein [Gemmatimonadales bacterium]|jgi:hypothetical protein